MSTTATRPTEVRLPVLKGRARTHVGSVTPEAGMETSLGTIEKVNKKSITVDDNRLSGSALDECYVTLTEARNYGFAG